MQDLQLLKLFFNNLGTIGTAQNYVPTQGAKRRAQVVHARLEAGLPEP